LYAFFPEKMLEVFRALNLPGYENRLENWELLALRAENVDFEIKEKASILFERV
jgi:hypothetical protein